MRAFGVLPKCRIDVLHAAVAAGEAAGNTRVRGMEGAAVLEFSYMGRTARYSARVCAINALTSIGLGARRDLKVSFLGCNESAPWATVYHWVRGLSIVFSSPAFAGRGGSAAARRRLVRHGGAL